MTQRNGCRASTREQLYEVESKYLLNGHAKEVLGRGSEFHKPIDDDVPTNEDMIGTASEVDLDLDENVDPILAIEDVESIAKWRIDLGVVHLTFALILRLF
ncbi:hypothetical protein H5410_027820 [Solanum commersonii]|uniref:Uncharacterized protein n=1 Tax=Solanum commersonii TaxID=4109 RepID=A0A9J5Z2Z4_SOLCO|nr:hypothetical protein H5410_027820 [Solanum commersonii]